jgi:hypothetical protein
MTYVAKVGELVLPRTSCSILCFLEFVTTEQFLPQVGNKLDKTCAEYQWTARKKEGREKERKNEGRKQLNI